MEETSINFSPKYVSNPTVKTKKSFYMVPNHNSNSIYITIHFPELDCTLDNIIYGDPTVPTMSKHSATIARNNSMLTSRNVRQTQGLGGWQDMEKINYVYKMI